MLRSLQRRSKHGEPGARMVDIEIESDKVIFIVEGLDKLWALKSRLEIPLAHITGARVDDAAAKGAWHGVNVGGANIPGVITAGSFFREGRLLFYDTHKPENTIVVDLDHEDYDQLILQVRDPARVVHALTQAIAR
jgi:hypothetical protein